MRVYFDTEFIENGRTIDLISLGMVREDGHELYLVSSEFDEAKASEWVKTHVLTQLGEVARQPRHVIRDLVSDFCGTQPIFWTYYGAYDWVVLCQLFGSMMQLPTGWPFFAYDLRQWLNHKGLADIKQPDDAPHHALLDARWIAETHQRYVETSDGARAHDGAAP